MKVDVREYEEVLEQINMILSGKRSAEVKLEKDRKGSYNIIVVETGRNVMLRTPLDTGYKARTFEYDCTESEKEYLKKMTSFDSDMAMIK